MSSKCGVNLDRKAKRILGYSRWGQIAAAAAMMALVSPYQYVWSSIEGPLAIELDTSLSALGFVFTAYVIIMALVQIPAGWWRDRYGPRIVTLIAGLFAGGGYVGLAFATNLWQVYLFYSIGAVGVGMVYTVAVNTAVKWFPDKRGLTTGIGTMAFAAGSAAFVPFIRFMIADGAITAGLWSMGLLIGCGIIVGTVILKDPPLNWDRDGTAVASTNQTDGATTSERDSAGTDRILDEETSQYTWREMVKTWQFWAMYFMFFGVSAAGLMITARVILYAEYSGLTAGAATLAATLLPIGSAGGRLIVGGFSDRFDRELTMGFSFLICGIATVAVVLFASLENKYGYIIFVAIAVFFWSSQFSLFPSLVGDYYGSKYSSTNYSLVYSGKMWGGVFGGGVVGWLIGIIGWDTTFLIGGGLALAAGLAGFVLRPPDATETR